MSTQPTSALNIPPQILPAINADFDPERTSARSKKRAPKKRKSVTKTKAINRLAAARKLKPVAKRKVATKAATPEKTEILAAPVLENELGNSAAVTNPSAEAPIAHPAVEESLIALPFDLQPAVEPVLESAREMPIPAREESAFDSLSVADCSSFESSDLSEPVAANESEVSIETKQESPVELTVLPPVNEPESMQAIATQRKTFLNILAAAWTWLQEKFKSHQVRKRLRVCETVSLGEKRFVAVIQVDGEQFLVGGSSTSISTLAHLERRQEFADVLRSQGEQDLSQA